MEFFRLCVGDRVIMRKQHPCGSKEFEVTRTGVDMKLKCMGCGRIIMDTREKLQKKIKSVSYRAQTEESHEP